RCIDSRVVTEERLGAHFDLLAGRWLEVEVEFAIGPVRELVEGRRLEALAGTGIHVERRADRIDDANGRRGLAEAHAAAVVAVDADDVLVLDLERNPRV